MAKNSKIIDGKRIAKQIAAQITSDWQAQSSQLPPPKLAIIQVGDDHASSIYVQKKIQACHRIGFLTERIHLCAQSQQQDVYQTITMLNHDPSVTGILLQLPLPPHCYTPDLLAAIDPNKDVDAITPISMGRLMSGNYAILPCTAQAVLSLLQSANITLPGARVVMVGASTLVGRPTAIVLLHHHATVTICHSETKDLRNHVQQAEILIVAIGNPNVIQPDWIPTGCVVIDVGINRRSDHQIVGDIPTEKVMDKVSRITPVPGGVGPATVAHLVKNLYTLYIHHQLPHLKAQAL